MRHYGKQKEIVIYGAKITAYNDGSVWNHRGSRNKRRFGDTTDKGYKSIKICDRGVERTVFVHRIIALAFIPNPNNLPQVNHINGIRTDNRPENLEWCTNKENARHRAYILKNFSATTPVLCVETGIKYETVSDASRKTNINRGNIQRCLKDGRKAGGYHRQKVEVI